MERCGLDRLEEMKEYLGQEKEQLLMQRMEEAGRRFGDKGCGCKADLEVIIKGLAMGRAEGSVVIASLRSGYITGDGEFYVAYYAGPPFVEEEPDSVCYSMKELLRGVEQDLENMNGKLRQKFIRIMASEQEEIRRWYMDEIYRRMGGVFRKEWGNREKEGQIDIFYGNYMDSVEGGGPGMKYFIVSVDGNYVPPAAIGWYGVIDRMTLHKKKAYEVQKHLLFLVEKHMQMVFTDVVAFPCFMVSGMVREAIKKYAPFLKYVRVILFQKEEGKSMAYYIPYLEQIPVGRDKDGKGIYLDGEKAGNRVIMEAADRDRLHIVMRMDLVESILRRGAVGIGLKEIKVW